MFPVPKVSWVQLRGAETHDCFRVLGEILRQKAKLSRENRVLLVLFFSSQGLASACSVSSRSASNFPSFLSPQIHTIRRKLLHTSFWLVITLVIFLVCKSKYFSVLIHSFPEMVIIFLFSVFCYLSQRGESWSKNTDTELYILHGNVSSKVTVFTR